MASFNMNKSLLLLVIITVAFSSSCSGSPAKILGHLFKSLGKGKKNTNHNNQFFWKMNKEQEQAQENGYNLANKYFGNVKEGFRWGYKAGNRIQSVASKCGDFMDVMNNNSCSQLNQLPGIAVVYCIVEVITYPRSCKAYESYQYPPEATCDLLDLNTLGSNCTL